MSLATLNKEIATLQKQNPWLSNELLNVVALKALAEKSPSILQSVVIPALQDYAARQQRQTVNAAREVC